MAVSPLLMRSRDNELNLGCLSCAEDLLPVWWQIAMHIKPRMRKEGIRVTWFIAVFTILVLVRLAIRRIIANSFTWRVVGYVVAHVCLYAFLIICMWVSECCFTARSVQSWQYRDRGKPEAGIMPYSYFEWLQGFYIVRNTICSTVHSRPLNSLDHCICTTTMTNIRPDRDLNLVTPDYRP